MSHQQYGIFSSPVNMTSKEVKFTTFFNDVLKKYFSFGSKKVLGIKIVLSSGRELVAEDFEKNFEIFQFAYILRHGTREACLSLRMFNDAAVKYEGIIRRLCCKSRINICCVGSSSVLAALGICHALNDLVLQFGFQGSSTTDVQIILIGKDHNWKRLFKYTIEQADFKYTRINIKFALLEANLCLEFSGKVKTCLQKSHIVMMDNFLAHPSPCGSAKIIEEMLKEMKKKAILFFKDDAGEGKSDAIKNLMSRNTDFSEVTTFEEQFLPQEERKTNQPEFRNSIFEMDWNTNFPIVICSTWIKSPKLTPNTSAVSVDQNSECPKLFEAKKSANKLRNSKGNFVLNGKFADVDMEKKNKDDTNRKEAKEISVSRYATFDDEY